MEKPPFTGRNSTLLRSYLAIAAALICAILLPMRAEAQTITMTGGVQTYPSLTNTTVTMTGTSQLFITGSSSPLSGCVINLNSTDSWLYLTGVLPSVTISTYLSQVQVNGVGAAVGTNVRVVQYGAGAVVIPQSSSFQPLQVFSGAYFTGSSAFLNQYTTYNTPALLGAMSESISSFKLKRGYIATIAQNADGTGASNCYIAADGDLNISVLPPGLQNNVSFVAVYPWRWMMKKGISGDTTLNGSLNIGWWYDWNIDQVSSPDLEYVAIRQNSSWPGLGQNWKSLGVNTVLGFNEPDSSTQANMTVASAIAEWPLLLGTGLRVGSPATTDGGPSSWTEPFMTSAAQNSLRVDFVAQHYYQCHTPSDYAGCATQLFNFLNSIYKATHKQIWITEWNNGANWTTCGDPTFDQQNGAIAAMIQMMDTTPFVERYALYNWVEDVRSVVLSGTLTEAGITYAAEQSPIGYIQAVPGNGSRGIVQLPFDGSPLDTSGYGNNGVAVGAPTYTSGVKGQAILLDGTNSHVQLPANVANGASFSYAGWVYWNGGASFQRIFDFGNDTSNFLFLTPSSSSNTMRFGIEVNGGTEQTLDTNPLTPGVWTHVAVTMSGGTTDIYVNGALVATTTAITINPSQIVPSLNYLGRSQFPADPHFAGAFDDVHIADYAFTAAQVNSLMADNPPVFSSSIVNGGSATQGQLYSLSLAGMATDPDAGDTVIYSIATGPSWLTVNSSGVLSGTPTFTDQGSENFTVAATDSSGQTSFTVVTITLPGILGTGTWSVDTSGTWSDSTKWTGSFPANGAGNTGNFSTLNITADRTVTLDSSRTIGALLFGDTGGSQNWNLVNANGATLNLIGIPPALPTITVNNNTATIALALTGTTGFEKTGAGTLMLTGNNTISGVLQVDNSSNTSSQGTVDAANPGALTNIKSIQFGTNNAGSSTLKLDGSLGPVTCTGTIGLTGRNNTVPAIWSVSGSNTLSGAMSINVGGGTYTFQSDNGILMMGAATAIATGTRTLSYQGSGITDITGVVSNGSSLINVAAAGPGELIMGSANNTFSGSLTVTGGTLAAITPASFSNGNGPTKSCFGNPQTAGRTITVSSGATLLFGAGNVFGSNTASKVPLISIVVNQGGTLAINAPVPTTPGTGGGDSNMLGNLTLNGCTVSTGNGLSSAYQAAILTGTVTTAGSIATTIFSTATNSIACGMNLGKTGGGTVTFNISSPLNIWTPLVNSANGGTGALLKTGAGTLTLSASNNYGGATGVSAGTLVLDGTLISTGTCTVAPTASFGGVGSTSATVLMGGTHTPGDTLGKVQTFTGPLTYQSTGRLEWGLGSNSAAAGVSNQVSAKTVTVAAGAVVDLILNGSGSTVGFANAFWGQSHTWQVLAGTSVSGSFALGNVSMDSLGQTYAGNGTFSVSSSSTGVSVVYTAFTAFQKWQQANFGANWNNGSVSGDTANASGDGISNIFKYAMGLNPNALNAAAAPQVAANNGKLTITFTRNTAATDVTMNVLAADSSAGPWTTIASSTGGTPFAAVVAGATAGEVGTGNPVMVSVGDVYSIGDPTHPHRYLRLQVSH